MWQIGINSLFLILAFINQMIAVAAVLNKEYTVATYYILVAIFFLLFASTLQNLFRDK